MRVLYVTSYPLEYDSSSNVRNLSLIGGMIKNGDIVSTFSPYPTDLKYFTGQLLDYPFEKRYWIGSHKELNKKEKKLNKPSKLKSILAEWYSKICLYDRRSRLANLVKTDNVDENFDIVVSSSDPKSAHLIAEKLIESRPTICKKWIQYWGDPFTNDITSIKLIPDFLIKKEERRILGKADKIVYVSPLTAHVAKRMYPEYTDKIEFYPIPFRVDNVRREFNPQNRLVSYIGDYSSSVRNMQPLIDALNEMKIPSAIVGDSDIIVKPTEYLIVKKRLIGEELEEITKKTGVYVCVCNKSGTQIPGKIYHNVNTGAPILVILDGEYIEQLKDYLSSFNRYCMCLNKKEDIIRELTRIFEDYKPYDIPQQLLPDIIASKFLHNKLDII